MPKTNAEARHPNISGSLARERLLSKLAQAQAHRLTLVCAPPGYGKTTLAAQFAASARIRVVWHTVEERERDFPTFLSQVHDALREQLSDLDLIAGKPTTDPHESASAVASTLRATLREDLILILDDVQHLVGASRCETWLQTFLAVMPSRCHLILVSRTLPTLPLAEMIARREVLALGQEDLKFTDEEARALVEQLATDRTRSSELLPLIERLEGWPAGIVLAVQPLPAELERLFLQGSDGPDALFESLATAMLDAQPPGMRDFLLDSSTLIRLTPSLATTVLEIRSARRYINTALEKNLFLSRVAGGLTYHNLFRAFLQKTLRLRDPERFLRLHRRAADWFVSHGQIEEAFQHLMWAGEPQEACSVVEAHVPGYFVQGRVDTILRWNALLQQHGVHNLELLYASANIHIERLETDAALQELAEVERLAAQQMNWVRVAEAQLQRARIHMLNGHFLASIAQAEQILESGPQQDGLLARTLRTLGFSYFRLGQIGNALTYLEQALPLSRAHGDRLALSNLLQDLQVVYMRAGRLQDASACLQEVVALRREMSAGSPLALALNDLGYLYHQHGDYDEAMTTLLEGLSVVAPLHDHRTESYLLWSLADLQRDLANYTEAWQMLARALELIGNREPSLRCYVLNSMATLRRWQRQYEESSSLAQEAYTLADAHQLMLEKLVAQGNYWAAQGYIGEPERALVDLLATVQDLQALKSTAEAAQVLVLCAQQSLLSQNKLGAIDYVARAQRLVEAQGTLQPVLVEVLHEPELDALIANNPARFSAISGPLARLRAQQHKPVIQVETRTGSEPIYSLRIHTLGRERIERDGVPILPSEWRASAARELFFYLLFLGPQRREAICLDFWPDSEPSRVRSNFHTTLWRVRVALGENVIIFRNDQYLINPDLDIWCDAEEFQRLIRRARQLSARDARTEDMYRRAVDLYQGEFLPQLEAEWLSFYREQLAEGYLDSLVGVGRCSQARGDFRQAIRMYKQGLKHDPFREDVHRAVMTCYAALGERQKVYQHFHTMQALFRQELAAEPTRETIAHARALMA